MATSTPVLSQERRIVYEQLPSLGTVIASLVFPTLTKAPTPTFRLLSRPLTLQIESRKPAWNLICSVHPYPIIIIIVTVIQAEHPDTIPQPTSSALVPPFPYLAVSVRLAARPLHPNHRQNDETKKLPTQGQPQPQPTRPATCFSPPACSGSDSIPSPASSTHSTPFYASPRPHGIPSIT
jgi:hypothetical protein